MDSNIPSHLPIYVSADYQSKQLCGRDVIVSNLDELISQPIPEITDPPMPIMTETPFCSNQKPKIKSPFS